MSYEIKLPLFEGPFDLLLFFIERDELDIMDIPISEITNDFFEYILLYFRASRISPMDLSCREKHGTLIFFEIGDF